MDLPIPEFISRDVVAITSDMIAFYETTTGKTLQPGQPERLVINTLAYREVVLRNAINDAALQNLVAFSRAPILDYLGQLVGVTRLPAQPAQTIIEFNLLTGHPPLVIQQGTRITNADGSITVAVIADTPVGTGIDVIDVPCQSVDTGTQYNGYAIGNITTLVDVFAQFDSCYNTTITSSGADQETDDQLRVRIPLAPSSFSVAGPAGAYKYFALSAHPSIIDVSVTSPIPGQVNIYPLSNAGVPTPQPVLDAVFNLCNGDKVRPLTDTVLVIAPTPVNYTIQLDLTLYPNADDVFVVQQVSQLINDYKDNRGSKLGLDIVVNQIIALAMIDGVYDAALPSIPADIIIGNDEFGDCTAVSVNIVGINNG